MPTPRELQTLFNQGVNITQLLRDSQGLAQNSASIIEVAYDLQAGSYTRSMSDPKIAAYRKSYSEEIAKTILSLCKPTTILEAGVGEASTLGGVLQNLGAGVKGHGFDLSWSRTWHARCWLNTLGLPETVLCTGDLFSIPFADNSIDVVYTSHSIEPNGGNEVPILQELYRVTKDYLILLEPGYELASDEARQRMEMHGYCRNIHGHCESLGYEVLGHGLFPVVANPLNPTAVTIVRKPAQGRSPLHVLACPKFKTPMQEIGGALFSPEALVAYPVLGGIPCLRIENGILASKYEESEAHFLGG